NRPANTAQSLHDGAFTNRIYPTPAREATSAPAAVLAASITSVPAIRFSCNKPDCIASLTRAPSLMRVRAVIAGTDRTVAQETPLAVRPANPCGSTNPDGGRQTPDDSTNDIAPYEAPALAACNCAPDKTGSKLAE